MALNIGTPGSAVPHAVLTDQWLLRHITSFQAGLPLEIYEIWVAHDERKATSKESNLLATSSRDLRKLLVAHGSPRLLELLDNVQYWDTQWDLRYPAHLRTYSLDDVLVLAIENERLDILQWGIDRKITQRDPRILWQAAAKNGRPGDFSVVELLTTHFPLTASEMLSLFNTGTVADVRVSMLEWLHINMPTAVKKRASDFVNCAARRGDVAMIRFVNEHMAANAITLSAFQIAYEKPHFFVLGYLMEHRGDVLRANSWEAALLRKKIIEDTRLVVQALVSKHSLTENVHPRRPTRAGRRAAGSSPAS